VSGSAARNERHDASLYLAMQPVALRVARHLVLSVAPPVALGWQAPRRRGLLAGVLESVWRAALAVVLRVRRAAIRVVMRRRDG